MATNFASGKKAIALCDICGQRYKLKQLREQIVKTKKTNIMACPECWSPDHPQLQLGMYPINDPQALRNPRPDTSRTPSGNYSSRDIQWGWAPVGGSYSVSTGLTTSNLVATTSVGVVTIAMT